MNDQTATVVAFPEQPKKRHRAERMMLTDKMARTSLQLELGKKRQRIADAKVIGLFLDLRASGGRGYVVRGRIADGKNKAMIDVSIGQADAITIAQARKRATEVLAQMKLGLDPRKADTDAYTVARVVDEFIDHHQTKGTKTADKIERCVCRITRDLGQTAFDTITLLQWNNAVARSFKRNGYAPAADDAKWLRAMGRWAQETGRVATGFAAMVKAPELSSSAKAEAEEARDRLWTLHRAEWPVFWKATTAARSTVFRDYLRLLSLTGLRRREASLARWRDIDLDNGVWRIPATNAKMARSHTVYLGPLSTEILTGLGGDNPDTLVFPGRGGVVMSGWSKLIKPVSVAMGSPVLMHGLRRGYRTALAELGVSSDVAEAMIAHAPPKLERTYDKSVREQERRDAQRRLERAWMEDVT